MDDYKTLYQWCYINNIRPFNNFNSESKEGDDFMLKEISLDDFKIFLRDGHYKENSKPRKPLKFLELRMYRLVPYNISDIQKGIQFDHAKDDYYNKYFNDKQCEWFRTQWFTTIALNGGTSNEGHLVKQGFTESMYIGTMQGHLADLRTNNIKVGVFYEPDLNSMLTAINFIVDERVFNKIEYPDYVSFPLSKNAPLTEFNEWVKNDAIQYNKWVDKIGGKQNEFLRKFLSDKRLA